MTTTDPQLRRVQKLESILKVAQALNSVRDLDALLGLIVEHARQVAAAERGTIFLLDHAKGELWSRVAQRSGEIRMPATAGVAGHVATAKAPLNISDAYADRRFNPENDRATGFRTRNLLAVPVLSLHDEVVGVLELVNKQPDGNPFMAEDEELLLAFGGQAAAAIENAVLYDEVNRLFEGFISASVIAIESRDPATKGHSERVAKLTCGLAQAVHRASTGPFANVSFGPDQMRELRYSCLLHDFGKVGVREHVLVKEEKLYPAQRDALLARFDFIRRTMEKDALELKLAAFKQGRAEQAVAIDQDLARRLEELDGMRRFILACNIPTVLEKGGFEKLQEIASKTYQSFDGPHAYLTEQELASLSIPRGSLTEEDRREIESHVTQTYRYLSAIPWTRDLGKVPEIAYGHHEKLDGRGYPRRLSAPEIPLPARMMAVSDIFDALTASDRPYKPAMPLAKALDILRAEAKTGKLDVDLVDLFINEKVFLCIDSR